MVAGTPSERDHSAELLGTVLDALRDDPSQDVESIVRCHPGHEAEIRQLAEVVRIVRSGADGPLRDPTFDIDTLRAFGTVTIDDFRLLNEVGRGGMGVVFEAEQVSLARRVAIKLLAPGVRLSTRSVERFRREAAAAGSLHHTNIVPVYATGIWEGVPYYAMQFIEGRSLCQRIGEARSDGRGAGLLEPRLVLRWGHAIADALAHAHRHGVLHRDIKPSNIIIDCAEDPWITDFGLARCDASVSITMTGDIVGTVRYMSPEQARGGRAVDERADLYSLGATLFEALCGRPVFEGDDRDATLRRLLVERAPGVRSVRPDVPDDCAAIIDRLLEKEPERRYPSAAVLAEDLRRAIAGEALLLRPPGRLELARRFVQRHTLAVTLSAVAAAVLVAFSIGTFVLAMNLASERDRARQEAGRVDRVNDYLSKILALGGPRPGAANLSMRDALDVIVPEIGVEFANDPRTQAPLRLTVARLYWQWGELAKAEEQFRLSFESARIGFGLVSDEAIAAGTELASLLVFRGRLDAAGAVLGELDGRNRSVMLVHGHLRFAQDRIVEARDLAAAVLVAKDDRCVETSIQALDLLARASVCLGERAGAIAARREALRLAQQDRVARGPGGRAVDAENIEATATYYLAATLVENGTADDLAEAEALLQAEQTRFDANGEAESLLSALNEAILANIADGKGQVEIADGHFREALRIKRVLYGSSHAEIAATQCNYAHFLGRHGRVAEAVVEFDAAIATYREQFGEDHPRTADAKARRVKWADGSWQPDGFGSAPAGEVRTENFAGVPKSS